MTGEKLTPNLGKLNPISGLKRLVSLRSLVELLKSILKLIIIGGVAYAVIHRYMDQFSSLMQLGVNEILSFVGDVSFQLGLYTCMVLMIMAVLDFIYTRWQHHQDLKMTKQEVRDELVPIHKWPICPISALCEKFYPLHYNHMPVVKFFASLDLDQICLFLDEHESNR
jgi:flagellar biosynthesis protein FlhB